MSEEENKQTEHLEKMSDGRYKLTVDNYGGNKDHQHIQVYTKEELKEQHAQMKKKLHDNSEEMAAHKKNAVEYSDAEREELEHFKATFTKLQTYDKVMQAQARIEFLLTEQESVRKGLKDVEFILPELTRKK